MKRKSTLLTLFIIILFSFTFFIFPLSTTLTYAETTNKIDSNNALTDYEIDSSLFNVLKELAGHLVNGGNVLREFDVDVFNYTSHDVSYYNNVSSTYGEEILQDIKKGELYLSTGSYAKYGCLRNPNRFNIKNISGLNNLTLTNINTLFLDGNSITNVSASDLSIESLKKLSIRGNKLRSFTLSNDLTNLNELDLSSNNLKKVDISKLQEQDINAGPVVKLSCNEIEKLTDITFSNAKLSKLDLSFNYLNGITQQDIDSLNSRLNTDKIANILIQGITDFSKLYAGDEISVYQSSEIEDFNIKFFYNEESLFYKEGSNNLICYTTSGNIEKINIPAGKIKVQCFSGETLITNDESFSHLNPSVLEELTTINENGNYSIPIKNVTYKAYVNGKEVNSLKQDTDIKIVIEVKDIDNIPNKEDILSENGAKFYYYINNKQPINSNSIDINSNGSYNYLAYVSFDGISSERISIKAIRQDLKGVTWGIIVIIIIIVVGASGYYIFKWFKNGAQVAPLSEKEIFRMKKRNGTLTQTNDDDYISSLDAPRHETRVSDQNYDDEIMREDLNSFNDFSDEIKPTNDFPEDIDSKK